MSSPPRQRFASALRILGILVIAFAVGAAVPATGSLTEESTGHLVAYQFDGGSHHDAPDMCDEADPEWNVTVGSTTDGMLAPPDDLSDVFVIDVPRALVGKRLDVRASEAQGTPDVDVNVWAPGCIGDVFASINLPRAPPDPPAPGAGESQIAVEDPSEPWHCRDTSWVFMMSGVRYLPAPSSIHVAWTNGAERTLPILYEAHGWVAYRSTEDLGILLKGAWANVPTDWEGEFALAQGPCDAVDGGAVYGLPPVADYGRVWFTPIRAGPHVVEVTLADPRAAASFVMPVSCHYCSPEVEQLMEALSYLLGADQV